MAFAIPLLFNAKLLAPPVVTWPTELDPHQLIHHQIKSSSGNPGQ
jgi:hypothetical protein